MSRIEKLEREVKSLSDEELAQFRDWFLEFDWAPWDRQVERDAAAGTLDPLAEEALRAHETGRTTSL